MDKKDRKILEQLKENGRASYTEIADSINVTEATVRNRIKKLEDEGVIQGYSVNVREENSVSALMTVNLSTDKDIEKVISKFPTNVKIYELSGRYDLIVKLDGSSTSEINSLVDEIRAVNGVENTETFMVLENR